MNTLYNSYFKAIFFLKNLLKINRCKYNINADDIQLYIECSPSELDEAIQIMNIFWGTLSLGWKAMV